MIVLWLHLSSPLHICKRVLMSAENAASRRQVLVNLLYIHEHFVSVTLEKFTNPPAKKGVSSECAGYLFENVNFFPL